MTECGRKNDEWKNVNDNARIINSWCGKFNYDILFVAVDFCSITLLRSKQHKSFDVVEEEQSLMIKEKSSLVLFDQVFPFFIGSGVNVLICCNWIKIPTSPGLYSTRWSGLFTFRIVRKHRKKFMSPYRHFIIIILSFAIFHPHFVIPFFHPPYGSRFIETRWDRVLSHPRRPPRLNSVEVNHNFQGVTL